MAVVYSFSYSEFVLLREYQSYTSLYVKNASVAYAVNMLFSSKSLLFMPMAETRCICCIPEKQQLLWQNR